MNRRTLLGSGAGVAGSLAAGAAAAPATGGLGSAGGNADLNTHQAHLFDLTAAPPKDYDGGQIRQANQETFPILAGQDAAAVLVRLQPGAIREPHWHPSAWEMHYVISGRARFSLIETEGYHEQFDARAGHVVFLPQGGLHYFENTSPTEEYSALLVFNSSAQEPKDDIGLVAALNVIPRDVLATVFGVPAGTFDGVPQKVEPVVIARRRGPRR